MNVERLKNRHGKIWLNVGSGFYFLEDFANLDSNFLVFLSPIYPLIKPLLKLPAREWIETYRQKKKEHTFCFANGRYPLDIPENSVDHILISHFLEHLHYDNATVVLKNYFQILKPGGTVHIIVPDLAENAREYVSKIGDPQAADTFVQWSNFEKRRLPPFAVRLARSTGYFDLLHCWLYDYYSLQHLTSQVGFKILDKDDSPSADWRRKDPGQVNILVQKPLAS